MLKYIFVDDTLPCMELEHLRQNLSKDGTPEVEVLAENEVLERLKAPGQVSGQHPGKVLTQVPENLPGDSLVISHDLRLLRVAQEQGAATVCYLPPEGSRTSVEVPLPEGSQTSVEVSPLEEQTASGVNPDMYVEGFEEVDFPFLNRVYQRHHGIPWTILTTERCVVKEFSMEYLDALFELYAGEGMTDYVEPLYSYEKEREYQESYIRYMYGFYGYGMWIVCDRESGKLIGRAGVEHREELGDELELGYAIGVDYQKKGYATEVCTAILAYAGDELGYRRVNCLIEHGNQVSMHLAEKLGFAYQREMQVGDKTMMRYVKELAQE